MNNVPTLMLERTGKTLSSKQSVEDKSIKQLSELIQYSSLTASRAILFRRSISWWEELQFLKNISKIKETRSRDLEWSVEDQEQDDKALRRCVLFFFCVNFCICSLRTRLDSEIVLKQKLCFRTAFRKRFYKVSRNTLNFN